jgi:CubicO group peptidase (beta-lactamase class C family)
MSHSAGFTYGGQGGTELHKRYPASSNAAAAQMTPAQFLDTLGGLPLHYQPGTRWEYSFGLDIVGLAIEAVTKTRLGDALQRELFTPLGMVDTHFAVPPSKAARVAKALPRDPLTGEPQASRDVTQQLQFDCGGGCASGTALDYLRFAQMLLNKGTLDGTRVLGRKTVEHMTADHLASGVDLSVLHSFPVENVNGYGFGLGVAVRRHQGTAGVFGSPGDFHWSGAQGTTFWVDPQEQLAVVFMANTPGPIRRHYRQVIKTLVLQAIVD